jgi:hypothetical protein
MKRTSYTPNAVRAGNSKHDHRQGLGKERGVKKCGKKAYYITGVLITCMEKDKSILPAAFETETRKKKS